MQPCLHVSDYYFHRFRGGTVSNLVYLASQYNYYMKLSSPEKPTIGLLALAK